jgi:hypothetical protein
MSRKKYNKEKTKGIRHCGLAFSDPKSVGSFSMKDFEPVAEAGIANKFEFPDEGGNWRPIRSFVEDGKEVERGVMYIKARSRRL